MSLEDIPETLRERVAMMEGILIAAATGGLRENPHYETLRGEFMASHEVKDLLPNFVRIHRRLDAFWPFIKSEADTYAKRRQIISNAFTPLLDRLDNFNRNPSDEAVGDTFLSFDSESVHAVWKKALNRRDSDPDGAITSARTLLETVCKRILDELEITYDDKTDLPKLYTNVAKGLNIAPNQHSENAIKAILGGIIQSVNGIGTLRNILSDSHGRGGRLSVKPLPRHASLAVNTAGAVATFLVETFNARKESNVSPSQHIKHSRNRVITPFATQLYLPVTSL